MEIAHDELRDWQWAEVESGDKDGTDHEDKDNCEALSISFCLTIEQSLFGHDYHELLLL